jgi:outer membrane protein OmpA-like peptidoglycan-associated protein
MKKYLLLLLILISNLCLSQEYNDNSESISDCNGAMNILEPGSFSIQLTSKAGRENDLSNYPVLDESKEFNSVWCSFIAPFDGILYLDALIQNEKLEMVIFEQADYDPCEEIKKGKAEIVRLIQNTNSNKIGLSYDTLQGFLYPLNLKEGSKIKILFNTKSKNKSVIKLNLKFEPSNVNEIKAESKIVDKRIKNQTNKTISIFVRDVTNGKPIISNLTIEGLKEDALYSGSDFFFPIEKNGRIKIKCDAIGYFFADRNENILLEDDMELTIWLDPVAKGKTLQIEEIEFFPGTSDFMPKAEPKLRRLKDFMALNSDVKIEIQGHVFHIGENTYAAQKLSESRAKRVLTYLADNGIDKTRMTAIGYGNLKPIIALPRFAYEEQKNRRVEIKITN